MATLLTPKQYVAFVAKIFDFWLHWLCFLCFIVLPWPYFTLQYSRRVFCCCLIFVAYILIHFVPFHFIYFISFCGDIFLGLQKCHKSKVTIHYYYFIDTVCVAAGLKRNSLIVFLEFSLATLNSSGCSDLLYFPTIRQKNSILSPPSLAPTRTPRAHTFSNPINPSASHFFISLQRDKRCPWHQSQEVNL